MQARYQGAMTHPHLPEAEGTDAAGVVPEPVRHPPWLLRAGGAVAAAMLVLVILGWTIDRGHRFAIDRAALLALRRAGDLAVPIGPHWIEDLMLALTTLGGG